MLMLLFGLVLFLGIHSTNLVAHDARQRAVLRLGEKPWKGLYTIVSLAGLALIVLGYGQARLTPTVLYTPPTALRHAALLLLVPVFPLLVAAYTQGRIRQAVKHPMLLATKLWAAAHLLANGSLADVLLFGGFLAWAVALRISLKRRGVVPAPYQPKLSHDLLALFVGLALAGWFIVQGHAWLIGVSPIQRG